MDSRVESRRVGRQRVVSPRTKNTMDPLRFTSIHQPIGLGMSKAIPAAIKMLVVCLVTFLICAPLFSQGNAGRILGRRNGPTECRRARRHRNHHRHATRHFPNP